MYQQHQSMPALNRFSTSISLFPIWGYSLLVSSLLSLSPSCFFNPLIAFLLWFSQWLPLCTWGLFASTKAVGWAPCLPAGGGAQRRKESCSDPLPPLALPPLHLLKPLKVTAVRFYWCPGVRKISVALNSAGLARSELALGRVPVHRCRKCWYQKLGVTPTPCICDTTIVPESAFGFACFGPLEWEQREHQLGWHCPFSFMSPLSTFRKWDG